MCEKANNVNFNIRIFNEKGGEGGSCEVKASFRFLFSAHTKDPNVFLNIVNTVTFLNLRKCPPNMKTTSSLGIPA